MLKNLWRISLFDQITRRPFFLYRSLAGQVRSVDRLDGTERAFPKDLANNMSLCPSINHQDSTHVKARPRPRILISHQGCVPIYRKPLYDRLAKLEDFEYVIACGEPPRGNKYIVAQRPYDFPTLPVANKEILIGKKSVIWQTLFRRFWREFDAAILGDEVKYLSHLAVIIAAKIRRRPVVLWGFGYWSSYNPLSAGRPEGRFAGWFGRALQRARVRLADGFLAYTDSGAAALAKEGFPRDRIVVMQNTVDIELQWRLRDEILHEPEEESRRALGLPPAVPVLVYFGRLMPRKHVDLLIDYIRYCKRNGRVVYAVISGIGVERRNLIQRAEGLETIFFRALADEALARALRVASAVVIPGYVGLAITHAFAHGIPMITREGKHPPEFKYLLPGENGLILPKDATGFFRGLDDYLADPALQRHLRSGAKATAERLSMDTSVSAMNELLKRLLNRTGSH